MILDPNGMPILQPTVDNAETATFNDAFAAVGNAVVAVENVRQIQTYKWADNAARTAQTGMVAGDEGYQTDTDTAYRYDGAAWNEQSSSGLALVTPTAPSAGVTVGAGGGVSFSGVSSISLTCFTAQYDNYQVVLNYTTTGSSGGRVRLRSGASDITTSTYDFQLVQGNAATISGVRSNASNYWETMGILGASDVATQINFSSPNLTAKTLFSSDLLAYSGNDPWSMLYKGGNRNATAYDGFTYFSSSAPMTGSLRVYGYSNG